MYSTIIYYFLNKPYKILCFSKRKLQSWTKAVTTLPEKDLFRQTREFQFQCPILTFRDILETEYVTTFETYLLNPIRAF